MSDYWFNTKNGYAISGISPKSLSNFKSREDGTLMRVDHSKGETHYWVNNKWIPYLEYHRLRREGKIS